jgi:hypothetical protein
MTIAQIIILSITIIILVGILISYHVDLYHKRMDSLNEMKFLFALLMIFFLSFISITSVIHINKLHKQLKCPEYERVENIYKLKQ